MKIKTSLDITPRLEKIVLRRAGLEDGCCPDSRRLKVLARHVKQLSDAYTQTEGPPCKGLFDDRDAVSAYLLYYLPVNLVKLHPLLDELASSQDAPLVQGPAFSMLDLGCGPGTFLAGLLEYITKNRRHISPPIRELYLAGADQSRENLSAAADIIKDYLTAAEPGEGLICKTSFTQASITSAAFYGSLPEQSCYDLITAGNVLNEAAGDNMVKLLKTVEQLLSPRGALMIIDPGTRHASRNLFALRDRILRETGLALFAPCLTEGPCPAAADGRQWCHEKIAWTPPAAVRAVDSLTGFTKHKGTTFSYFTFVHRGSRRRLPRTGESGATLWRAVSYLIKNKGEERLYVCSGTQKILLRRLTKNSSQGNEAFSRTRRGDLVAFDGCEKRNGFLDITKESGFKIIS